MDPFSAVVAIGGTLGIGTQIGQWVARRADRKKRREERIEARDEKHRAELTQAYAELMAAQHRFLDAALLLGGINAAIAEFVVEGRAVPERLQTRGEQSLEDFNKTSIEVTVKRVVVQLLDADADRRAQVENIHPIVAPQTDADWARFEQDITDTRRTLETFAASIAGQLSPDRYYAQRETRALVAAR